MLTDRFEAWWPQNPARLMLSPEAKDVARRVWHAARADMVTEMQEVVAPAPNPSFKEMADALWVSQLGIQQPEPMQREPWESVTAFEDRYVRAHGRPAVKENPC